jgi:hypothetical protein
MMLNVIALVLLFSCSALAGPEPSSLVAVEVPKAPLPPQQTGAKPEDPKPVQAGQQAVPSADQRKPDTPAAPKTVADGPALQPVPLIDTAAEVVDDGEDEELLPEIVEFTGEELDDLDDGDSSEFYTDRHGRPHRRHHGGPGKHHRPHHHRRPHPRPGPGPRPTGRPHTGPTRRPHPHPTRRPHLGLNNENRDWESSSSFESKSDQNGVESSEQSSSSSEELPKSMPGAEASLRSVGEPHKDIERKRIEEYAMLKVREFRRTCGLIAIILGWATLLIVLSVCARFFCCYLRHRRMGMGFLARQRRCTNGVPYAVMVDATHSDRMPIIASEQPGATAAKE